MKTPKFCLILGCTKNGFTVCFWRSSFQPCCRQMRPWMGSSVCWWRLELPAQSVTHVPV